MPVPPLRRTLYQPIAGQFFGAAFYLYLSLHEEKTAHERTNPLSKKADTDCYRGHGTPNSKKSTDFYGRACNLCRTGHPSTKYRATLTQLYETSDATFRTLAQDIQFTHAGYPVLEAISNLYLNKQIAFEKL